MREKSGFFITWMEESGPEVKLNPEEGPVIKGFGFEGTTVCLVVTFYFSISLILLN